MALDIDEWLTDSNECTYITLDRHGRDVNESFHPTFTYPIFGEDEKIVGYQGLRIDLRFRSHDLHPSLKITHKRKIAVESEEIKKAMILEPKIQEFLPEDAELDTYTPQEDENGFTWRPPGEIMYEYEADGRSYEIWTANLANKEARRLLANMRILIPFYIEGGTCNFLDDPEWTLARWNIYLFYEIAGMIPDSAASPYSLVGFCTSYRNWVYPTKEISDILAVKPVDAEASNTGAELDPTFDIPDWDPLETPCRDRISQFLILPPYQGQALGTELYNAVTGTFLNSPSCFEITVEDPNEQFDDLRDYCDMARLLRDEEFTSLALPTALDNNLLSKDEPVPIPSLLSTDLLKTIRHRHKLAPRQFSRLLEMRLYSTIPPRHRSVARISRKHRSSDPHDRQYYFWRLLVKARIYKRNKEQLGQVEEDERVSKLEDTIAGVEEEYTRILEGVEKRKSWADASARDSRAKEESPKPDRKKGSKRKLAVVDDDEDEEEADDDDDIRSKRSRITPA